MDTQLPANPEVIVTGSDGRTLEGGLTMRELWTVQAAARVLEATPELKTACGEGAKLTRIESMRGVPEHQAGRYYLRFEGALGVTEFWAHLSRAAHLDIGRGVVAVAATATTPPLIAPAADQRISPANDA